MDFRLLGRFEVVDDDRPIELGRRMTRQMRRILPGRVPLDP